MMPEEYAYLVCGNPMLAEQMGFIVTITRRDVMLETGLSHFDIPLQTAMQAAFVAKSYAEYKGIDVPKEMIKNLSSATWWQCPYTESFIIDVKYNVYVMPTLRQLAQA